MTRRNNCLVPFCARTTGRWVHHEWICADHWKLVSRKSRRLFFKAIRQKRFEVAAHIWKRLRRQAIERAGGIG